MSKFVNDPKLDELKRKDKFINDEVDNIVAVLFRAKDNKVDLINKGLSFLFIKFTMKIDDALLILKTFIEKHGDKYYGFYIKIADNFSVLIKLVRYEELVKLVTVDTYNYEFGVIDAYWKRKTYINQRIQGLYERILGQEKEKEKEYFISVWDDYDHCLYIVKEAIMKYGVEQKQPIYAKLNKDKVLIRFVSPEEILKLKTKYTHDLLPSLSLIEDNLLC